MHAVGDVKFSLVDLLIAAPMFYDLTAKCCTEKAQFFDQNFEAGKTLFISIIFFYKFSKSILSLIYRIS